MISILVLYAASRRLVSATTLVLVTPNLYP